MWSGNLRSALPPLWAKRHQQKTKKKTKPKTPETHRYHRNCNTITAIQQSTYHHYNSLTIPSSLLKTVTHIAEHFTQSQQHPLHEKFYCNSLASFVLATLSCRITRCCSLSSASPHLNTKEKFYSQLKS